MDNQIKKEAFGLMILFFKKLYIFYLRKRLRNKDVTIISRDCTGGCIYHQLGLQFKSPTINLYFDNLDFCYFCNHLKEYLSFPLKEYATSFSFPVGILCPINSNLPMIKVYFMHYESFSQAKECWERRRNRVRFNNIFVLLNYCKQEEMSEKLIMLFNSIAFPKAFIYDTENVNKTIIEKRIDSSYPIKNGVSKARKYHSLEINQFNFVKHFNGIRRDK